MQHRLQCKESVATRLNPNTIGDTEHDQEIGASFRRINSAPFSQASRSSRRRHRTRRHFAVGFRRRQRQGHAALRERRTRSCRLSSKTPAHSADCPPAATGNAVRHFQRRPDHAERCFLRALSLERHSHIDRSAILSDQGRRQRQHAARTVACRSQADGRHGRRDRRQPMLRQQPRIVHAARQRRPAGERRHGQCALGRRAAEEGVGKAGVKAGSVQVAFNGMDKPPVGNGPDFVKALNIDHALDGEVMLACQMNGTDLPVLNGYPVRLIVPGYYGTYWVKHVEDIQVTDKVFDGFWMSTAYRIPDNACACIEPGTAPTKTTPINRFDVRSFITSVSNGTHVPAGRETVVRGIAFDGGYGITEVAFSADGGKSWVAAQLGKDLGRYSFREWTVPFRPQAKGAYDLKVKATNRIGQSQPLTALWNPMGYMRNVVETTRVVVAEGDAMSTYKLLLGAALTAAAFAM